MEKYLIVGITEEGKQVTSSADSFEMAEVIESAMYDSDLGIVQIKILFATDVMIKSPSKETIFEYLDELRESGITNMFGAVPYIMGEFDGVTKDEAIKFLGEWMRTFKSRKQATTK